MTEVVICLDKSKPFSECSGECAPDDPLYRVRYWQGQRVSGHWVLLPFDGQGNLVPDDGKKETWQGVHEGKPITYHPLYNDKMRALVEAKKKRAAAITQPEETEEEAAGGEQADASDDVNFVAWLKGQARYEPHLLRAAAKKRFSKNYQNTKDLVVDLVEDERLVDEAEVCPALAKHLKQAAAV